MEVLDKRRLQPHAWDPLDHLALSGRDIGLFVQAKGGRFSLKWEGVWLSLEALLSTDGNIMYGLWNSGLRHCGVDIPNGCQFKSQCTTSDPAPS